MGENESASSFKAISIKDLEKLETTFRPEECIYEAPPAIRNLNRAAFTPRVISIGPFHHCSKNLKPMEIQKQRYLKEFCKRLRGQTEEQVDKSLKELRRTIEDRKDAIKRRYADTYRNIKWDNDHQFVENILLDAVFIFELFLKTKEYRGDRTMYQYDFIIGKPWLRAAIQRDLILLENQLPFFILEELYNRATDYYRAGYPPFLDLSRLYFENYGKIKTMHDKPLHFTDLVRYFLSFKHPKLESTDKRLHFNDVVRYFLPSKHQKLEPPDGKQIKNPYSATPTRDLLENKTYRLDVSFLEINLLPLYDLITV
ncbi:hypothetical protein OIU77_010096 [Salix suchowensis]|uniref:Uncharacterized protein n=1 Tax=Salix suchowensis TaxID=1278906 RepID=A0ABQ9A8X0_9ROSI|nr:hypothetical protein OIU77_010096 [Salix suchowensis]